MAELIESSIDALGERKLFAQRGVVYGGFIRDAVAGVKPKDIDVVLSKDYIDFFDGWMNGAGYVGKLNEHNVTMVWRKAGRLPVESYSVEDSPDDVMLSPEADPDFDVNTLCYNGERVYSWINPDEDLVPIVEHIREKEAEQLGENVTQEPRFSRKDTQSCKNSKSSRDSE